MINDRKLYEVHISMFDGWDLGIGIEIVPLPKEQRSPARTHAVRLTLYSQRYRKIRQI